MVLPDEPAHLSGAERAHSANQPAAPLPSVYDDYRQFVNPPLARVMRLAGSPTEASAQGCYVTDDTGKRYLDFAGGYGTFIAGHRHPEIVAAVRAQLDEMALSSKVMFSPLLGRLARKLAEITPGDLQYSFVCNSGAEAMEAAIKLCRAASGKTRIVATENAYHGKTAGALSVSGREEYRAPFGELLADVVHVPFGDIAALQAQLAGAAACIIEPLQAEGGAIPAPDGYLPAVERACREAGVLFVVDEIQTGFGRCGKPFYCDFENVRPDVMTLAKGLSGGIIPIGACIATEAVWKAAYGRAPLLHTSTFGGNPLACAAALAAIGVFENERLADAAAERGAYLLEKLREFPERYRPAVSAIRGRGLLLGLVCTHEGYAGAIIPQLLKRGVTAAWTLNARNVIRLEPPLIISEAEIDYAVAALAEAIEHAIAQIGARVHD